MIFLKSQFLKKKKKKTPLNSFSNIKMTASLRSDLFFFQKKQKQQKEKKNN